MKLAIIGTAGRGTDAAGLKPGYYCSMCTVAQAVCTVLGADHLVSGGAAVSDHIAVRLFLDGVAPKLALHLPAEWTTHGFKETSSRFDTGRTSNWYHALFSERERIDSLGEIQQAIERGAEIKMGAGGFKERNTDIARQADVMLAFTFGQGATLKDGGTADTWNKFGREAQRRFDEARVHYEESCCGCQNNQPPSDAFVGYHFDLNSRRLYRHVFEDKIPEAKRQAQLEEGERQRHEECARAVRVIPPDFPF